MSKHRKTRALIVLFSVLFLTTFCAVSAMATGSCSIPFQSPPAGTVGQSYSYQVQFTTIEMITPTFALVTPLPPGLTINATSGFITGVPTTAGTYSVQIKLTDVQFWSCQNSLTITINKATILGIVSPPIISGNSSLTWTKSLSYTFTSMVGNVTLNSTQGTFKVGSTVIGTVSTTLTATMSNRIGTATEIITVPPSVMQAALAQGSSIMTYSRSFTGSGAANAVNTGVQITIIPDVSGSVSPSIVSGPSSLTWTTSLSYAFASTGGNVTLNSTQGTFKVGSTVIGTVSTPLTATMSNNRSFVTETLSVPPSVMQAALARGSSRMTYSRSFTGNSSTINTEVQINITSESAADFLITGMQLYFQNRMPNITINRLDRSLKAYAKLNYVGSGMLQGYWEVDGNFLSNVKQLVTQGNTIIIESPSPPQLPTFDSGYHQIRFVITNPSQNIPFPVINYYITTAEPEVRKMASVNISFPFNQGVINYEPTTFLWTAQTGVNIYFLEFFRKGEEKAAFSAYTKAPHYQIPEAILKNYFSRGKSYSWRVKGFDALNRATAESALVTFTIRE